MRKKLRLFLSNRSLSANLINSLSISGDGMSDSQEDEDEVWQDLHHRLTLQIDLAWMSGFLTVWPWRHG
jgi:hypothetical protein